MQHSPFPKTKRNANISFLLGLLTAAFCASPAQALQFDFSDVTGNLTDGDADGVGATMRYNDVASENGTTYDLLITTLDSYQVKNTASNGSINGNDGSINLLSNTSTTFRFSVVAADTNNLVTPSSIEFGIYDLDGEPSVSQERISLNTSASYTVTEDPATALAIETFEGERVEFTAPSTEIANPTDSRLLTQEQEQHSVNFVFNNTSEFDLGFEVIGGNRFGRNIFFAGDVIFDDSITSTTNFKAVPFEVSPGWGLLVSVGTLFGFNYLKKRSSLNNEVELR